MRYRLSDATSTAETFVPSASAFALAASHTSSGMRTLRSGVLANGLHASLGTRRSACHGVRVVREVDEAVTTSLRLSDRRECSGDEGLPAAAVFALACDLHAATVPTDCTYSQALSKPTSTASQPHSNEVT